jgi:hypothetical protein
MGGNRLDVLITKIVSFFRSKNNTLFDAYVPGLVKSIREETLGRLTNTENILGVST